MNRVFGLRSVGCNSIQRIRAQCFSESVEVAAVFGDSTAGGSVDDNKSKRHTVKRVRFSPQNIHEALKLAKEKSWAGFDETVELAINTGLDPRKPNQNIKGMAPLPFGTGKKVRVCVFATGADAKNALDAGAEVVGSEDLVAEIQSGNINFDTCIATPEMMGLVGKIGKILGPRGMMPNPKMGTVTKDPAKAVRAAKAGSTKFKAAKHGVIQVGIGKVSFSHEALAGNIRSFMLAVAELKPDGFKGKYIVRASISTSMGPGIPVDVSSVDPGTGKFMLELSDLQAN